MSSPTATAEAEPAPGLFERYGAFLFRRRNLLFPVVMTLTAGAGLLWSAPDSDRAAAYALGLALLTAGQALRILVVGLAYIKRGGMNKQVFAQDLVTAGMFAHCRNPLYVGNLAVAAGLLTLTGSMTALAVGMAFFASAYAAIVATEERYLENRFGDSFRDYCREVPRWLLRLRGLLDTVRSFGFDWRRVLAKEYPTVTTTVLSTCAILSVRELRGGASPTRVALVSGLIALLSIAAALLAKRFKKRTAQRLSAA